VARDEGGFSLVIALLVTSVLTISTVAVATMTASTERSFGRDRQEVRAIDLGQTGLNYGVSYMSGWLNANDTNNTQTAGATVGSSTTPQYTATVDGGTVKWWATKTGADTWTIYSTGISPTGAVTRRQSLQMKATTTTSTSTTTSTTAASDIYAYGYVMADPNADCASVTPPANGGDTLANSAAITVPIWIASSLCLSGGGAPLIAEPNASGTQSVSLYVGKVFRTEGNATPVGTSARKILSANIVGGCQAYFKKNWTNQVCSTPGNPVNGSGSGIQASSYLAQQVSLTKPTIDTGLYGTADLNKTTHDCAATTPGGAPLSTGLFKLDNDSTRNTGLQIPSGSGTVKMLELKNTNQSDTGNNFDCRWYDGVGNLVGQLTWVDGNPGTLTIKGSVYIDGRRNALLRQLPDDLGHVDEQPRDRRRQPPERHERDHDRRRREVPGHPLRERQLQEHEQRQRLRQRHRRHRPDERGREVRQPHAAAAGGSGRPGDDHDDDHDIDDDLERPEGQLVAVLTARQR
jgi:Tfp pilus assembly protein PilX